jgi:hypothetical protein
VGASGRGHGEARPGIPPQIQAILILILILILASSEQQKCSTYMVRTYGRSAGAEASRSMSMSMEHGAWSSRAWALNKGMDADDYSSPPTPGAC